MVDEFFGAWYQLKKLLFYYALLKYWDIYFTND